MGKHSDQVTTTKKAHAVIDELARRNGTFTPGFRREVEEEAEYGDEELQENSVAVLKMWEWHATIHKISHSTEITIP